MKDSKGERHEAPIIKSPYLKNLLNKTIDVVFADRSCIGVFEGEDLDFISIITKEGQEFISKHSIKRIIPIYVQSGGDAQRTGRFTYALGQGTIYMPMIPDTFNHSYDITAYVNRSAPDVQGVLQSIGGSFGGLSLFVQNNHLVFDYNYNSLKHYTMTSKSEVPTGKSVLSMVFNLTGDHKGIATLLINGHNEGNVDVLCELGDVYSIEEGLEIGKDTHTPVTDSYKRPGHSFLSQ